MNGKTTFYVKSSQSQINALNGKGNVKSSKVKTSQKNKIK